MTLFKRLSLVIFLAITFLNQGCETPNNRPPKHIIIIGIDGLSVEGFKTANIPNLKGLANDGALSLTTRSVMPSVTLPNWTSHLTGSGPEQHGVNGNGWLLEQHPLEPTAQDSLGYYPSIFKVLKEQVKDIQIGYYYNWGNLINAINKTYLDEISFLDNDGYLENYNKALTFAIKNKNNPSLIFLYAVNVDHAGHKSGWLSEDYINTLEDLDAAIGSLLTSLKNEGLYDSTNFFVITDHGGINHGHGGMSPEEMIIPWIATGPSIKKNFIIEEPNSNTNTSMVLSRIFSCDNYLPKAWIGKVPESIFENQH